MLDSYVNIQGETKIRNRAYGHILENDKIIIKDQYWCSATIGDGGIYSTVNDLKKWCIYLSKSECFKDMKVPNYVNEKTSNDYGYGIRIFNLNNKEVYCHTGSTIGTNTLLLFSVDLNICLIFLTNLNIKDASIMKDNLFAILSNK